MKVQKIFLAISLLFLLVSVAAAEDFAWTQDFNKKAEANYSDFKAKLAERFKIGSKEVNNVLKNTEKPADAYTLLRLGEMSGRPTDEVLEKYKANKEKGWGAMAKSLGIKPGSKEFKALKQDSDLYKEGAGAKGKEEDKGKGKDKDKDKGQDKGKDKGKN